MDLRNRFFYKSFTNINGHVWICELLKTHLVCIDIHNNVFLPPYLKLVRTWILFYCFSRL